jgi:hypothetical protein
VKKFCAFSKFRKKKLLMQKKISWKREEIGRTVLQGDFCPGRI